LHQKELWPHQVPDRQADNGGDDQADDERWKAAGRRALGHVAQLFDRIAAARLRCIGTGLGHLAAIARGEYLTAPLTIGANGRFWNKNGPNRLGARASIGISRRSGDEER